MINNYNITVFVKFCNSLAARNSSSLSQFTIFYSLEHFKQGHMKSLRWMIAALVNVSPIARYPWIWHPWPVQQYRNSAHHRQAGQRNRCVYSWLMSRSSRLNSHLLFLLVVHNLLQAMKMGQSDYRASRCLNEDWSIHWALKFSSLLSWKYDDHFEGSWLIDLSSLVSHAPTVYSSWWKLSVRSGLGLLVVFSGQDLGFKSLPTSDRILCLRFEG